MPASFRAKRSLFTPADIRIITRLAYGTAADDSWIGNNSAVSHSWPACARWIMGTGFVPRAAAR